MSRSFVLAALVFACLGLAVGLNGPFVHDDFSNLALTLIPDPSWHQAVDAVLSNGSGLLKRPLSNASFLLNFLLLGDSAMAFKAVNLGLHLLNGVLVFLLGRRVLAAVLPWQHADQSAAIALAAAMLWLAHPLNVSTVLYVVQRMTELSACFVLVALWWLVRHLSEQQDHGLRRKLLVIAGFYAATLFAVLSKESGALAPVYAGAVVLLLGHGNLLGFMHRHRLVLAATVSLPMLVGLVGLALGWGTISSAYVDRPFDMAQRLASESVVMWKYVAHIVLPLPQFMHFFWDAEPVRNFGEPLVSASLAAWAALFALAIWCYRASPWPLFALAWFLGGHTLESSIVALDLGYDHRNYLPMVGPVLAFAAAAFRALHGRTPLRSATLFAVALLMLATGMRSLTWSSLSRLAAHEVTIVPKSLRAQYNAHVLAANRKDWDAAHRHLAAMERLDPAPQWIEVNRVLLRCQGDPSPLDAARVRDAILASASDERTQRGLQQLLDLEIAGTCQASLPYDIRELLTALAEKAQAHSAELSAADYYYMAASLDWNRGDLAASAQMLRHSARLAPANSGPAERLVMVLLTQGDTQGASAALERARAIWQAKEPWRLYRYREWNSAIAEAEGSLAPISEREN